MDRTNIWAPKGIPNGVNCKIPYKGYEISIAMDDSCGTMKDWARSDIRVFVADRNNVNFGKDVSEQFFLGDSNMLYGDAETLLHIFKKIDEAQ
jgi:hypothetical protein